MLTPLFLDIYRKYRDAIQYDKAFFQLCCNHLGFLVTDYNFDFQCNSWEGPDAGVGASFTNNTLKIGVGMCGFYSLPRLSVMSASETRRGFDLAVLASEYGFENDDGNFQDTYMRVHPLDGLGQDAVNRQYRDAIADRITRFGICVYDNLDKFKLAV